MNIRQFIFALMLGVALSGNVSAAPFDVHYQGRLVDATGKPIAGPVNLTLKFFHTASGGVAVMTKTVADVTLAQGIFSVALPLDADERDDVFGNAAGAWIEVTSGGKTYPRQAFTAVPFALKVGVQQQLGLDSGDFVTTITANPAAIANVDLVLPADNGDPNQVLKTDGAGNLFWDAPASGTGNMDGTNNLSELTNDAVARTNLGLGDAAEKNVGTGAGDVAAGNHGHAAATGATAGFMAAADKTKLDGIETAADVTDAANVDTAGAVMNGDFLSNGIMRRTGAGTYDILTDGSTNWTTGYNERRQWDGTSTNLNVATAKASLAYGSMADQSASAVNITGGTIAGVTMSGFTSTGIDDNADAVAMTIDSAERVGIGTVTPESALEVYGDTPVLTLTHNDSGGSTEVLVGDTLGTLAFRGRDAHVLGNDRVAATIDGVSENNWGNANEARGALVFKTRKDELQAPAERVRITSIGNVGVGTATPETALDVVSQWSAPIYARRFETSANGPSLHFFKARGTPGAPLPVVADDVVAGYVTGAYDGAVYDGVGYIRHRVESIAGGLIGSYIEMETSDSAGVVGERVRIDSAGNVGIGTPSPTAKLHVAGTAGVDGIKFPDGTLQTTAATTPGGTLKAALLGKTGTQTITTSTLTAITGFDVTHYDTASFFSGGAPDRLTVPVGVTYARVSASVRFASVTNGVRNLYIYKNGTPLSMPLGYGAVTSTIDSFGRINVVTPPLAVSPGDYFQAWVWQNDGANLNTIAVYLGIEAVNGTTVSSGGSGTANYIPLWSNTTSLGNSPIAVSGGSVGVGTAAPTQVLEVNGAIELGTTATCTNGAIRWTGTDFEGCRSLVWVSLTGGGTGIKTVSAKVDNDGSTCTILSQHGGTWLASVSHENTYNCINNITPGTFSSAPHCTCASETSSATADCNFIGPITTTSFKSRAGNSASPRYVVCVGPG